MSLGGYKYVAASSVVINQERRTWGPEIRACALSEEFCHTCNCNRKALNI